MKLITPAASPVATEVDDETENTDVYHCTFRTRAGDDDESPCVVLWKGELVRGEQEEVIGKMDAFTLHAGRAFNNPTMMAIYEQADAAGAETEEYASAMFDSKGGGFSPQVEKQFGEGYCNWDVLAIDKVMVNPAHRGKDLGEFFVHTAIHTLGQSSQYAVVKPWPMQCNPYPVVGWGVEQFPRSKAQALKSLRRYWESLGFERLRGTDLYVMNLEFFDTEGAVVD